MTVNVGQGDLAALEFNDFWVDYYGCNMSNVS